MLTSRVVPLGLAVAGAISIPPPASSPAGAAPIPGRITLAGAPGIISTVYQDCQTPHQRQMAGAFTEFVNEPQEGCQVLLTRGAQSAILCSGRRAVPAEFRQDPLIQIRAGTSRPCGIGTRASG